MSIESSAARPETLVPRRRFLRTAGLMVGGLTLVRSSSLAAPLSAVPKSRLDRLSKGANVAKWFRYPRAENAAHFGQYISETEAAQIYRMGLQHVRLCIHPKIMMDPTTGAIREENFGYLEAAIQRFQRAKLLVVVDMHNEDRPSELNPTWQEAFVKFWGALATRLAKYDADMTIFEIINEPVFNKRETEWDALNARLAGTIRQSAPQHTIITSGANWGGIDGLKKMKLLEDKNVVYSFHCYDPFTFTHQGATWSSEEVKPLRGVPYPSSPEAVVPVLAALADKPKSRGMVERYGKEHWNKEKLAARFKQGIDWGARNGVALYCGEFGVYPPHSKPEHRANWFRDFGEVLAENRILWAVWGWDEGFGLNRKLVDGQPAVDQVVAKALGLQT
ncbi:MAG: cellulase family glycosylhydrolase [Verrucomicrobiota bacterium]